MAMSAGFNPVFSRAESSPCCDQQMNSPKNVAAKVLTEIGFNSRSCNPCSASKNAAAYGDRPIKDDDDKIGAYGDDDDDNQPDLPDYDNASPIKTWIANLISNTGFGKFASFMGLGGGMLNRRSAASPCSNSNDCCSRKMSVRTDGLSAKSFRSAAMAGAPILALRPGGWFKSNNV
jgi:hypothetical protein